VSNRRLDAVVQLFKDQLLQLVGRLALPGVDAGPGKKAAGIDLGVREEKPQTDVLCRQIVLVRFCAASRGAGLYGDYFRASPIVSL